jgi:N-ethylmaleimide reductase
MMLIVIIIFNHPQPGTNMTNPSLFSPYVMGGLTLANRIVMAPLTRNRAGAGLVPNALASTYYAQRASAGLIITKATQVSVQAQGYQDTPGLYTPEQIAEWSKVTDAVHAKGGRIFVQLWHVGRISHVTSNQAALRRWHLLPFALKPRPSSTTDLPMCQCHARSTLVSCRAS